MCEQIALETTESFEKVSGAKVNEKRMSNVFEASYVKTNRWWKRDQEKQLNGNKVLTGQYILKVKKCFF